MTLLSIADEAFAEAKRRAGEWIACKSGCDECCRTPFAITEEDAARLQLSVVELGLQDIVERADVAWEKMIADFPGDAATGVLDENPEWRAWFFARHKGTACPVLDEATGACRLYEYRPVCCRIYGPLIEIGGQVSDPCPLCYCGASDAEIESTRVRVDLPPCEESSRDTVIAFALSSRKLRSFRNDRRSPYDEEPESPR